MKIVCKSAVKQVLHINAITVDTAVSQNVPLNDHKQNIIYFRLYAIMLYLELIYHSAFL